MSSCDTRLPIADCTSERRKIYIAKPLLLIPYCLLEEIGKRWQGCRLACHVRVRVRTPLLSALIVHARPGSQLQHHHSQDAKGADKTTEVDASM
jgi:hypothetical protein